MYLDKEMSLKFSDVFAELNKTYGIKQSDGEKKVIDGMILELMNKHI